MKFIPLHVLNRARTQDTEDTIQVQMRIVPASRILDVNVNTGRVILFREYPTTTKEEVVHVTQESMHNLVSNLLEIPEDQI